MNKSRLEAFSDGVLAIIITIMVLEIKVPHGTTLTDLLPLYPTFVSYFISFLFVGIYWGNHHHLFSAVQKINSRIMLANLNLLFWLSLMPWATGWMGENHFAPINTAVYAFELTLCGVSYLVLQLLIAKNIIPTPALTLAMKRQSIKSYISAAILFAAAVAAFCYTAISVVLFLVIIVMWLIPDKNIERAFDNKED